MSKKVLIVEDDLFSANMFKQILRNSGFDSIIVENGLLALEELDKDNCISTCLLDLNMPVMDGYEFLRALSTKPEIQNLDIYITSSNSEDVFIENITGQEINTGMIKGYYEKPFDFNNIVTRLS